MARKHLIKGTNATRVEERIGNVPLDLSSTDSIFQKINAMKKDEDSIKKSKRNPSVKKQNNTSSSSVSKKLKEEENLVQISQQEIPKQEESIVHFSKPEKELIIKCCKNYKNTIPSYLRVYQNELKLISHILLKCGFKD